jgi:hypothetical protein
MSIIPVDEQFYSDEAKKWLDEHNLMLPDKWKLGHTPSFNEIQKSLETIPDLTTDYQITKTMWHAAVYKNNFHLSFNAPFTGNLDAPYSTGVKGSIDLMSEIITELVQLCGTTIILSDGEDPILFIAIDT